MPKIGKRKAKKQSPKVAPANLDELLEDRYHGASNISGIRYQILFSVLKSFDLYNPDLPDARIRLEGIEDVDLLGFQFGDRFIQAKNYKRNFTWSLLDEPLNNFVQTYQTDSSCTFILVLGGPMSAELEIINNFPNINKRSLNILRTNLKVRCKEIKISFKDALEVTERLEVIPISELQILADLRQEVAQKFGLGTEAVDIYIYALVAKFLEWAQARKTISREDLDGVRANVGEKISSEEQFEAYGKGLIGRIAWSADQNETDFFDGKATRSGHIAANLDVPRPLWLNRIDSAFKSVKVCVVLSSSGQGKSTLLFRYARQQQFVENPFLLRIAEEPEQVELVIKYLRFWSQLIPSALVLIDNAGWRTRLWPLVAQECAALGIKVLVSTRQEDWYRFRQESLTGYELVEPVLNEEEAKDIYSIFRRKKRIHRGVKSSQWAYEQIGSPHLLMEYVYLLTHGQMLKERLSEQLRQFRQQDEDPAKREILRRASIAHIFGCHLQTDKLVQTISMQGDVQEILQSIEKEYLILESGHIKGLHWVRSDHLARILHDASTPATVTAIATLDAVPKDQAQAFVANALSNDLISKEEFLDGLLQIVRGKQLGEILTIMQGTFEGGERIFFETHKGLFDEALGKFGWSGPKLLSSFIVPTRENHPWRRLSESPGDLGATFRILEGLAEKCSVSQRGRELCSEFLERLVPDLHQQQLLQHLGHMGQFLDWCYFCGVRIPDWSETKEILAGEGGILGYGTEDFCWFCQGLGRYDAEAYQLWFENFGEDIVGYLRCRIDCLTLEIVDNKVSIEFLVADKQDFNEQAVSRLRKLRAALPLCDQYRSQGIWAMPYGLTPPEDATNKDLEADKLQFESDIAKNRVWNEAVERYFLPDSYYRYEEAWYEVRRNALDFAGWVKKIIAKKLAGDQVSRGFVEAGSTVWEALSTGLKVRLDPPPQTPKDLRRKLESSVNKWSSDLENFVRQVIHYARDGDDHTGNLAFMNFHNSRNLLKEVHEAFDALFDVAPDYFAAARLNDKELEYYAILEDHLYSWIVDPPPNNLRDVSVYARRRRRESVQNNLARVETSFAPLMEAGRTVILPQDIVEADFLTHLPMAISVDNPVQPEQALMDAIEALKDARDVADFVYVIPLYNSTPLISGAYRFSPDRIDEILSKGLQVWDYLAALELPEAIKAQLPDLPYTPRPSLRILGNVNVIFGELHPLALVKEYISRLESSANRFGIAQSSRLAANVQSMFDRIKENADETHKLILSQFPSPQEDPLLKPSVEFLDSVIATKDSDDLLQLAQSGDFDIEFILQSLMDRTQRPV